MGSRIQQRTKDGFFNATELLSIYNSVSEKKKVFAEFWSNQNTQLFLKELEQEIVNSNTGKSLDLKTHESSRGRGGATWMHPYLFVKFAMWLSPKFELQIIKWVYDNLIEFRNQAGDHFKEMCSVIYKNYEDFFKEKASPLVYQAEARFLNSLVYGTFESGKRNELSESELSLLNNLQVLNIKLIESKQFSKKQRYQRLAEFAQNYKMINF